MNHPAHKALRDLQGFDPLVSDDLTDAIHRLGPIELNGLSVLITDTGLTCTAAERTHEATFKELALLWEGADLILSDREILLGHISTWCDTRPVADQEALGRGVAALHWDHGQDEPQWTVFVLRGQTIRPWVPMLTTPSTHTIKVRNAALDRARVLNHDTRVIGGTTVWTHREHPGLSSCIVASEPWVHEQAVRDMYVILTPDHSRAVLTGPHEVISRLQATARRPMVVRHASAIQKFRWK